MPGSRRRAHPRYPQGGRGTERDLVDAAGEPRMEVDSEAVAKFGGSAGEALDRIAKGGALKGG